MAELVGAYTSTVGCIIWVSSCPSAIFIRKKTINYGVHMKFLGLTQTLRLGLKPSCVELSVTNSLRCYTNDVYTFIKGC